MTKRLTLTPLEDRSTPATFTVTTIADNGSNATPTAGSLRAAIIAANNSAGADTIAFNITGGGVQPIAPPIALPSITEAVTLDGTTQPSFAGTPVIFLNGSGAGATANGLELLNHTGSTIRGFTIGNFGGSGIRISGGGSHTIAGNFIGTSQNGTAAAKNTTGISIENASVGTLIGGSSANARNIIAGNGTGIAINNAYSNTLAGNFIGTDINGTAAIAGQVTGIALTNGATGNTIGGVAAGFGNIISGNSGSGVAISGANTTSNVVAGNRIGLSLAGTALANGGDGILVSGAAATGSIAKDSNNAIRSNTIARNTGAGVRVTGNSRLARIETNSIRENGGLGIQVDAGSNNNLAAPLITSVVNSGGSQLVNGTVTGLANTKYAISIYTSPTADPSGKGEGATWIGTFTINTDGSGAGTFQSVLASSNPGTFVSATVTDDTLGDTSEFSNAFARPNTLLSSGNFAVGGGAGGDPTTVLTDTVGTSVRTATYFDSSFTGGVRVATGDLTGDGIPDLAVATGVGIKAEVRVYNSATQELLFTVNPFGDFTRGVFVALGDVNNDGTADIIITPDEGGGSRVRVFNGKTFAQIADFFGIQDVNFRGGARAAVGDMNNDDFGDIAVSAGFGGGPRIAVFSGATLGSNGGPKLFGDFFAFESSLRNGAYVAITDIDGDGFGELIAAAGPGGAPRVRALNGKTLINSQGQTQTAIVDFFAGGTTSRGGVRILGRDLNGDGKGEIVTGQADGSRITVFQGSDLANNVTTNGKGFDLLDSRNGGMFVG